jgi:hypothetical protein
MTLLSLLLPLATIVVGTPAAPGGGATSGDGLIEQRETASIEALRRLNGGEFQLVDDPTEQARAIAMMQRRLHDIGIKAEIGRCEWLGLVAQGTSGGNLSYGAACKVRVGREPERSLLICNANLGGFSLIEPDVYASDPSYIELFIRRACL